MPTYMCNKCLGDGEEPCFLHYEGPGNKPKTCPFVGDEAEWEKVE